MRSPVTLTPAYKFALALTVPFAIAGIALGASLIHHYSPVFPGDALKNVLIQTLFALSWSTLFGTIWLVGLVSLPRSFFQAHLGNWTVFFLAFLQLLVASGTLVVELSKVTCSASRCVTLGPAWCIRDHCNTFHALQGVAWVVTWLTFLLLLLIAWDVCLHGEEHESRIKDYSGLKREMTRDSARAGLSPVRTRMSAVGEVAGNGNGV